MTSRFRSLTHLFTRTKAETPAPVETSSLRARGLHPWLLPPVNVNDVLPSTAPPFVQAVAGQALRELHSSTRSLPIHIPSPTSSATAVGAAGGPAVTADFVGGNYTAAIEAMGGRVINLGQSAGRPLDPLAETDPVPSDDEPSSAPETDR
ncbi:MULTISPECIES: hypothetical protein [Rhodococcus]|uniref:hypothetical protein n=1 Tax=Rhodococcus TaxID=1827 RepID=UPI0006BA1EDE|nr:MULTISPECIES: hypothetical protein [Rhodococcus]KPH20729.1 hypothetical protein AN948_05600 [Rhodococcus sp. ADH]